MSNLAAILAPTSYDPGVTVTGVSFRTLDVAGREVLARKAPQPEKLAQRIVQEGLAKEAAVISTCNRFEVISVGAEGGGIRTFFSALLEEHASRTDVLYQLQDQKAVRHLYRVSASLDSMVLGEAQILGQVKQAYRRAVEAGSVGSHLHHLFQSAFNVAKRIRVQTEISQHGVSVSYVAVRLAQQIFSDLSQTSVLIIGSGEMAELAALHLCSRGCSRIVVANRTVERAAEIAERFGGAAVALGDVDRVIDQADIVIGSIAIDRPILSAQSLRGRGRDKPLFLIDLGMPRNFASNLAEQDSVYLYNIDDLAGIAAENRELREAAAKEAELVIEYGLLQFERWRAKLASRPEIVDLRAKIEAICAAEVARHAGKGLSGRDLDVAKLAHAISQKLAHEITSVLERQDVVTGEDDSRPPFLLLPRR